MIDGWWLAGGSAMLVGIGTAWAVYRRRRSPRCVALAEMEALKARWHRDCDFQTMAGEVSILLRRVAVKRFGRESVADLHGEKWQAFLSETGPRASTKRSWDTDIGKILALAPYAPPGTECPWSPLSRDYLLEKAAAWIKENS